MPFALNGTVLLNPATHKWVLPALYGTSLVGRPLYGGVLAYELNWPFLTQSEFNTLIDAYNSGSVISSLPQWHGYTATPVAYDFENYTGTYLGMPEYQSYFDGMYQGVKVLINNVNV